MRILLDMDGVIADFDQEFLQRVTPRNFMSLWKRELLFILKMNIPKNSSQWWMKYY
jgi:hypothetical protein